MFSPEHLITDILTYPELRENTITSFDGYQQNRWILLPPSLRRSSGNMGSDKIESTTNRQKALEGADYVFITIRVEDQMIARTTVKLSRNMASESSPDTVGAGGIFYGLRNGQVILDICRDMEQLCPDAWLMNYTNPMSIISWAVSDYTKIKNVGLCHSVPNTTAQLAKYMDIPYNEVSCWVAGINHMAWFLELKWKGRDAYPLLREKFKDPAVYSGKETDSWQVPDIVRAEVFKNFGYYVTESSMHMGTYVSYFKKRPELIKKFKLAEPSAEQLEAPRRQQDEELRQQLSTNYKFPLVHSGEYGSIIINSIETGKPSRINGNVKNNHLITNLPEGCCVEVPCLVDKEGIHPCFVGDLPPQLAALNRTNINVHELAVRGITEKDKTKLFQAALLDPLTAAILTIDEIREMVDELFKANEQYLNGFK